MSPIFRSPQSGATLRETDSRRSHVNVFLLDWLCVQTNKCSRPRAAPWQGGRSFQCSHDKEQLNLPAVQSRQKLCAKHLIPQQTAASARCLPAVYWAGCMIQESITSALCCASKRLLGQPTVELVRILQAFHTGSINPNSKPKQALGSNNQLPALTAIEFPSGTRGLHLAVIIEPSQLLVPIDEGTNWQNRCHRKAKASIGPCFKMGGPLQ